MAPARDACASALHGLVEAATCLRAVVHAIRRQRDDERSHLPFFFFSPPFSDSISIGADATGSL